MCGGAGGEAQTAAAAPRQAVAPASAAGTLASHREAAGQLGDGSVTFHAEPRCGHPPPGLEQLGEGAARLWDLLQKSVD